MRGLLRNDPSSLLPLFQNAEIVFLQETHLADGMTPPSFSGFTGFSLSHCSGSDTPRGGVAIYVRADLEPFTRRLMNEDDDAHTLWLRIDQESGFDRTLSLFCSYFPPSLTCLVFCLALFGLLLLRFLRCLLLLCELLCCSSCASCAAFCCTS